MRSPPLNVADSAAAYGGSIFDMMITLRNGMYENDIHRIGGDGLRGIDPAPAPDLHEVVAAQHERTRTLVEMAEISEFFYRDFEHYDEAAAKKHLRPVAQEPLQRVREALSALDGQSELTWIFPLATTLPVPATLSASQECGSTAWIEYGPPTLSSDAAVAVALTSQSRKPMTAPRIDGRVFATSTWMALSQRANLPVFGGTFTVTSGARSPVM